MSIMEAVNVGLNTIGFISCFVMIYSFFSMRSFLTTLIWEVKKGNQIYQEIRDRISKVEAEVRKERE